MHTISAAGFYSTLLIKLQNEFKFDLHGYVDIKARSIFKMNCSGETSKGCTDSKSIEFALGLTHRIYIYLGDLGTLSV